MSKKNWQITSRTELLLAKIAGRNVDLNTMTPPVASNATEELLLEIADRLDRAGGGETTTGQKDVNIIDYDGTICYSYSASEFANLTALPANPSHSGLTAQGWNWSLTDAKAYVAKYGKLWIGQMYITDDGKTRIYIHLEEGRTSPMLGCCPNGTVVVDWGDGSATETLTGTSLTTVKWTNTHNYAGAGDYVITLEVTSGTVALRGHSSDNQYAYLLRYSSNADGRNVGYQNAIQRVEIGENISTGDLAFLGCLSLASITIPDGVTSIDTGAFSGCFSLASITIPDSVTSIGSSAFQYCYSLASITIPDGVTSINTSAFSKCYSLASITIPDIVTSIDNGAFSDCYSLASITIPDGVTSIGMYAFYNCYSLASITIPDSVTSIEEAAFSRCFSLANITIPDSVTSIGEDAFGACYSLASITIPDGVTSIGDGAFNSCSSLASITIPDGVESIGINAFLFCYSLASITIPDGVTSIGEDAFSSCPSLVSITIPDSVTSIDNGAFSDCSGLAKIRFEPTTPPTVAGSGAWSSIPTDCVFSVPTGTLSAYTSATNYPSSSTYTYIEED